MKKTVVFSRKGKKIRSSELPKELELEAEEEARKKNA